VRVYVDEWNCGDVFVPNIFSPNNDGRNDEIIPFNNCIEYLEFRIYDRWGNLVFESIDKNKASWDGTFQNKPASEGIYYYFLKVKLFDKRVLNQKGSITLIR
jgi:gliding motility-associated-like protein